jgi:hypothetical protein
MLLSTNITQGEGPPPKQEREPLPRLQRLPVPPPRPPTRKDARALRQGPPTQITGHRGHTSLLHNTYSAGAAFPLSLPKNTAERAHRPRLAAAVASLAPYSNTPPPSHHSAAAAAAAPLGNGAALPLRPLLPLPGCWPATRGRRRSDSMEAKRSSW